MMKSPIRYRWYQTTHFSFALLFAIATGIGMTAGSILDSLKHPVEHRYGLIINQKVRDFRYVFYQDGDADCFVHDLCPNTVEPGTDFKPRTVIADFAYRNLDDTESCWSINPDEHAGYNKKRDRQTKDFVRWSGTFPDTDTCAVRKVVNVIRGG